MKRARPLLSVAAALSVTACSTPPAPAQNTIAADPPKPAVIASPRVLPSGRPACGNVASKAPRPPECDEKIH